MVRSNCVGFDSSTVLVGAMIPYLEFYFVFSFCLFGVNSMLIERLKVSMS